MGSTLIQRISLSARKKLGYDFFISYSRKDASAYARELHRRLDEAGYLAFIDRDEIHAGNKLSRAIRSGIRGSKCLLFIDTPRARASRFVRTERRMARARRIREIRIVDEGEQIDDRRVWVPEVSEALEYGLPSDAALAAITAHAAGMRSRFRFRIAAFLILLTMGGLAAQRVKHAVAGYHYLAAIERRYDDAASIEDVDRSSQRAVSWEPDNALFAQGLEAARRVVLKRRGVVRRADTVGSADVLFASIAGDDPLSIVVVTTDNLLRAIWSPAPPGRFGCAVFNIACTGENHATFRPVVTEPGEAPTLHDPRPLGRIDYATGTADGSTIAIGSQLGVAIIKAGRRYECRTDGVAVSSLALTPDGSALVGRSVGKDGADDRILFWRSSSCASTVAVVPFAFGDIAVADCPSILSDDWRRALAVSADGAMVAVPAPDGVVHVIRKSMTTGTASFGPGSPAPCAVAFVGAPPTAQLVAATRGTLNVFRDEGVGGWVRDGGAPIDSVTKFFPMSADSFLTLSDGERPSFSLWTQEARGDGTTWSESQETRFGRSVNQVLPFGQGGYVVAFHDGGSAVFARSAKGGWLGSDDAVVGALDTTGVVSVQATERWLLAQTPREAVVFEVRR